MRAKFGATDNKLASQRGPKTGLKIEFKPELRSKPALSQYWNSLEKRSKFITRVPSFLCSAKKLTNMDDQGTFKCGWTARILQCEF